MPNGKPTKKKIGPGGGGGRFHFPIFPPYGHEQLAFFHWNKVSVKHLMRSALKIKLKS